MHNIPFCVRMKLLVEIVVGSFKYLFSLLTPDVAKSNINSLCDVDEPAGCLFRILCGISHIVLVLV